MLDVNIFQLKSFVSEIDVARVTQQLAKLANYNQQFYRRPPNGQNTYCFRDKSNQRNSRAVEVLIQRSGEAVPEKQRDRECGLFGRADKSCFSEKRYPCWWW